MLLGFVGHHFIQPTINIFKRATLEGFLLRNGLQGGGTAALYSRVDMSEYVPGITQRQSESFQRITKLDSIF